MTVKTQLLLGGMLSLLAGAAFAQTSPPTTLPPEQAAKVKALQDQLQALNTQFQSATGQSLFPAAPTGTGNPAQPDQALPNGYADALRQLGGADPVQQANAAAEQRVTGSQPSGPHAKVPIGYLAAGVLDFTVNSDYPGPWRGKLTQPILSIDGKNILFPVGTNVVGRVIQIGGNNAAINNRLGLLPTYLVLPNGEPYKIKDQAILDELGISGIADQVDYHIGVQLAAIGAFTVVQALPNVVSAQAGATSLGTTTATTPQGTFVSQASNQGDQIISRYMALLPTITVRAGTPFRIFFNEEMLAPVTRPADSFQLTNVGLHGGTPPAGAN